MNKPCTSFHIPIQTRIFNRQLSLLGFIHEIPCPIKNNNRYLILYDNFTAGYSSPSEFHLCLCQDFRRHISNIEYKDLQTYYEHAFQNLNSSKESNYAIDDIIRVKKFGPQYHNTRIVDIDCSIIKVCFFERKSKTEMWIHSIASIIDQSQVISQSNELSLPSSPQTSIEDGNNSLRLRKRKSSNSKNESMFENNLPLNLPPPTFIS